MTQERERQSLGALDRSGCSQATRGAGADLTCRVSDGRGDWGRAFARAYDEAESCSDGWAAARAL